MAQNDAFEAFEKLEMLKQTLSNRFGKPIDLADKKGFKPGSLGEQYILKKALYVWDADRQNSLHTPMTRPSGAYSVRNFIAHDYDGINLAIVEKVIRVHLPKIKYTCKKFLEGQDL